MVSYQNLMQAGFANVALIDELYVKFQKDPASVDASWYPLFEGLKKEEGKKEELLFKEVFDQLPTDQLDKDTLRVLHLIEAYRTYGHYLAKVNPLMHEPLEEPWQLKLKALGFVPAELECYFPTCGLLKEPEATLQQLIICLREIYCAKMGIEYKGVENPAMEKWLQSQIEPNRFKIELSCEQKCLILQELNKAELFELFLHTKHTGQKRFSLQGGETLIPLLAALIEKGGQEGIEEVVLGMTHRGRLNVLSHILQKPYAEIFAEFEEGYISDGLEGGGDVKYHQGFLAHVTTRAGHKVSLELLSNPSHLESVDAVVAGKVYARQALRPDHGKQKVLPLLVHGDAAIAGQGVCYETMQLHRLPGYSTGGTLHIVLNNQIGLTTSPNEARSTSYCTDIARTFRAPVFHVNAEDPEGCVYAAILAVQLRQKYHCDVFIDLHCYRKVGHHEADEPAYTHPHYYQLVRQKKSIRELYREALIQQGILKEPTAKAWELEVKASLQKALQATRTYSSWSKKAKREEVELFASYSTGVPQPVLETLADKLCAIPAHFTLHPKLVALLDKRRRMGNGQIFLDWGMAETLAYASLLEEGISVRISGQDVCRGTFSHRHAVWVDQQNSQLYSPLCHLKEGQVRFEIFNSPLSEYAVLGFEYGYSLGHPHALVIWEAQFGDFANGAQIIIDQYLSSAEEKWGQKVGLVLFLPHGFEGQGPEHSSARIERFLSLAGNVNMQIVNPTTPAQFFHVLRRQALLTSKKPLVVFTPKELLRHPACQSSLQDLVEGSFQPLYEDPFSPQKVKTLVLCSGRIYYDLDEERKKRGAEEIAIIRLEQLYPFPIEKLKNVLKKYQGVQRWAWTQEEPSNMGAWPFIQSQLREILSSSLKLEYIGRICKASPAVGSKALHRQEQAELMQAVFGKKVS